MTLRYFQQPQVIQSACLDRPKDGARLAELDQLRLDDRISLEAAVSEGWPTPQPRARLANLKPQRPYRTAAQTWLRRRNTRIQP
jgi:hypothetical protein